MTSQLIIEQLVLFVIIEILKGEFFSLIENKFQYNWCKQATILFQYRKQCKFDFKQVAMLFLLKTGYSEILIENRLECNLYWKQVTM